MSKTEKIKENIIQDVNIINNVYLLIVDKYSGYKYFYLHC